MYQNTTIGPSPISWGAANQAMGDLGWSWASCWNRVKTWQNGQDQENKTRAHVAYVLGQWFSTTKNSYKTPNSASILRFWFNWFWITPRPRYSLGIWYASKVESHCFLGDSILLKAKGHYRQVTGYLSGVVSKSRLSGSQENQTGLPCPTGSKCFRVNLLQTALYQISSVFLQ